jgi:hypothetical protein
MKSFIRFLAVAAVVTLFVACPPVLQPPAAPSGLTATAISSSSIGVAWTDNSNNEVNFVVEYSKAADFSGKAEVNLAADTVSNVVESLEASTKYYFRVKAANAAGDSAYSNVSEATTQAPPVVIPAAPSGLTATAASSTSIQAAWTDASGNEDNFVLVYSLAADFTGSTEVILAANTTSKVVESLAANTKYYFRVKSVNTAGSSAWSNSANATTGNVIAGTMVINSEATYTTVTSVTINSNITAAAQMRFQNSGGAWSAWETYAATKTWSLASGADGTRTVNGEFKDAYGVVLAKSDSIILDATQPEVSSFYINGNAAYATEVNVTLSQSVSDGISGVAQMRFTNGDAWSEWMSYATSKAWTLSSGDGTKYVYAEFKDGAGNIHPYVYDTITLDTSHPAGTFLINNGAAYAWTTAATLNMNVTGAAQMRFMNSGGSWTAWETYATTKSWTLVASENSNRYVYAEFKDGAGNVTQYYDYILYDAIRTLRITAEYIVITDDGDTVGNGEIYWNFYGIGTGGSAFSIYNLLPYHSMDEGTWNFADVAVTHSMSNVPGEYYQIRFQIFDDDSPLSDDASSLVTYTYYASSNWGIGGTRTIYAGGSPSGYMYFKVEYVD